MDRQQFAVLCGRKNIVFHHAKLGSTYKDDVDNLMKRYEKHAQFVFYLQTLNEHELVPDCRSCLNKRNLA